MSASVDEHRDPAYKLSTAGATSQRQYDRHDSAADGPGRGSTSEFRVEQRGAPLCSTASNVPRKNQVANGNDEPEPDISTITSTLDALEKAIHWFELDDAAKDANEHRAPASEDLEQRMNHERSWVDNRGWKGTFPSWLKKLIFGAWLLGLAAAAVIFSIVAKRRCDRLEAELSYVLVGSCAHRRACPPPRQRAVQTRTCLCIITKHHASMHARQGGTTTSMAHISDVMHMHAAASDAATATLHATIDTRNGHCPATCLATLQYCTCIDVSQSLPGQGLLLRASPSQQGCRWPGPGPMIDVAIYRPLLRFIYVS